MTRHLAALLAAASLLGLAPPTRDGDALKGTWTLISATLDGQGATPEQVATAKLVVDGDRFTPTFDGNEIPCAFVLDPGARPATIDLTYTTGPAKGLTVKGIYRLKGDTFVMCRNLRPRDDRPTEFTSEAGSMRVLIAWTRVKP